MGKGDYTSARSLTAERAENAEKKRDVIRRRESEEKKR